MKSKAHADCPKMLSIKTGIERRCDKVGDGGGGGGGGAPAGETYSSGAGENHAPRGEIRTTTSNDGQRKKKKLRSQCATNKHLQILLTRCKAKLSTPPKVTMIAKSPTIRQAASYGSSMRKRGSSMLTTFQTHLRMARPGRRSSLSMLRKVSQQFDVICTSAQVREVQQCTHALRELEGHLKII